MARRMVPFGCWCLVVFVQGERPGHDVGCDLAGLIQSRAPSKSVRDLGHKKKPKLYVYDLPSRFQNGGHLEEKRGMPLDKWSSDMIFGGPPADVDGFPVWKSGNHDMALQLHYRFMNSQQRTLDVDEADVFLIPAYQMKYPDKYCANRSDLVETLVKLNPKLKDEHWLKEKGPRHLLANGRVEICEYMLDKEPPLRSAVRVSIGPEIKGTLRDGFFYTHRQPWDWYLFPYPSMFHGPKTPAHHRPRGMGKWLWTFSGKVAHGSSMPLRVHIRDHCLKDSKCAWTKKFYHNIIAVAQEKLHSTFCVEPAGDTLLRKSLMDSIVAGCIPVLFAHNALDLYGLLVTREEWAKATVFIPEAKLMAKQNWSHWATGTFLDGNSTAEELKKLHPEHASLFDALDPAHSSEQRHAAVEALFPKPSSISSVLRAISEEEVKKKQEALAKIAHRFVIGVDDSNGDAVNILLRHISARTPS